MRSQNPRLFDKVQEMTNGKSEKELKEIVNNAARERGIDLERFAGEMGIRI